LIADDIKGEVNSKGIMAQSEHGSGSLFKLFDDDIISYEEALRNADSVNDLRLRIKLESKLSLDRDVMSGTQNMSIT
jgi:twitching motility protein PilU